MPTDTTQLDISDTNIIEISVYFKLKNFTE